VRFYQDGLTLDEGGRDEKLVLVPLSGLSVEGGRMQQQSTLRYVGAKNHYPK